ncbi:MAG: hypothetical protein M0Z87_07260 [Actinomycetota bacterium]|nr:hypothetical protein [Actinomycetota bacterium]
MSEQLDLGAGGAEQPPFVGVIVQPDRAEEGLRMASALALGDNDVEVIVTGPALPDNDEIALHLDSLELEEIRVMCPFEDGRLETLSWAELASRLEEYDHVLTF